VNAVGEEVRARSSLELFEMAIADLDFDTQAEGRAFGCT